MLHHNKPQETKEEFYNSRREVLRRVLSTDKLIIARDVNARVGKEKDKRVIGPHGVGKCDSNGERLLALCSEHNLVITSAIFKHKEHLKTTWMHTVLNIGTFLDYIIVRQLDQNDILSTRSMRGADCSSIPELLPNHPARLM